MQVSLSLRASLQDGLTQRPEQTPPHQHHHHHHPQVYEMSARSVSVDSTLQIRGLSILLFVPWRSADDWWPPTITDVWESLAAEGETPSIKDRAERRVDKPHRGFMGLDLTRAEWMSES